MSDLMNIGIRGLLSFQAAMTVTGQNLANVRTPYYSRREINLAEDVLGNGVNVADVRRVFDDAASRFLRQSNSSLASCDTYLEQISELESLMGNQVIKDSQGNERSNNVASFINDAIKALRELNGDTGSMQSRTIYMNKLSALCNRFNAIGDQIDKQYLNINKSIESTVVHVNKITEQLAKLNLEISGGQGGDNAALLDQREALLQELSQYINYSTQTDDGGMINVLIDNGTPLVRGSGSNTLSAVADPSNPNALLIKLNSANYSLDVTKLISGGSLNAYYDSQASLQKAQNDLGRISLAIMDKFNAQNKLGIDYNGVLGGNIFNDINNPSAISQRVINSSSNTGSLSMSITIKDVSQLTSSDYKIVFDTPTHYVLTRKSDNTVVNTGTISSLPTQISVDGISVDIAAGTISAGDSYIISPMRGSSNAMNMAITDPKLLALGWPVIAQSSNQNTGDGAITVSDIIDTTNAAFSISKQLNPPIKVHFLTATTYELINTNTSSVIEGPLVYTPDADIFPTPGSYDPGYRIKISGANIKAGDTFTIDYNATGIGDNRNGQVMESIYTKGVLQGNSLSFTQGYNLMSSDISISVNNAKMNYVSSKAVFDGAMERFKQISGVSLPEETSNFAIYEQCYQASAQVIQAAKTIFDTIIGLGRN